MNNTGIVNVQTHFVNAKKHLFCTFYVDAIPIIAPDL